MFVLTWAATGFVHVLGKKYYESFRFFQFHGSDDLGTAEADSENDNASNKSNLSCGGFS
jgi:hypothetical protein